MNRCSSHCFDCEQQNAFKWLLRTTMTDCTVLSAAASEWTGRSFIWPLEPWSARSLNLNINMYVYSFTVYTLCCTYRAQSRRLTRTPHWSNGWDTVACALLARYTRFHWAFDCVMCLCACGFLCITTIRVCIWRTWRICISAAHIESTRMAIAPRSIQMCSTHKPVSFWVYTVAVVYHVSARRRRLIFICSKYQRIVSWIFGGQIRNEK